MENKSEDSLLDCDCWKEKGDFRSACLSSHCIYSYVNNACSSFEQFKIQIEHFPRHIYTSGVKKLLNKFGLNPSKVKLPKFGPCFVNFRSAKEQMSAVEILNGHVYKGCTLKVRITRPAADPLLLKRAIRNNPDNNQLPLKVPCLDISDDALSATSTLNVMEVIAPLWRLSYQPEQLDLKHKTAVNLLLKLRTTVLALNPSVPCDDCLEYGFLSSSFNPDSPDPCPIFPSPLEAGYRNKAEFTIGYDKNGNGPLIGCRLGKYANASIAVAAPPKGSIFSEKTLSIINQLQSLLDFLIHREDQSKHPFASLLLSSNKTEGTTTEMPNISSPSKQGFGVMESEKLLDSLAKMRAYEMVSKTGNWRRASIRESRLGDAILVVELFVGDLTELELDGLAGFLTLWFSPDGPGGSAGVTTLYMSVLKSISRQPGTYTDRLLFGKQEITESCYGLNFCISKDSFFQVNTQATEVLYEQVKQHCLSLSNQSPFHSTPTSKDDNRPSVLLDICCGTGTIGLCLAKYFDQVYGIEIVPEATADAKKNAQFNGITNAEFFAGRAEEMIKDVLARIPQGKITAVLDPPRAGVHNGVIEAIRRCERISQVVFVACDLLAAKQNFMSFARPTSKKYSGDPFWPIRATCVDLFPQTEHIEMVISLKRLNPLSCL